MNGTKPHLSTTANTTIVTTEGNTLVLDHHVLQVLVSLADVHAFDGLGGLAGVLRGRQHLIKVHSK